MIILTINGFKNCLTVEKDSNSKYTVNLFSNNSFLQRIGLYKATSVQTLEIDLRNYHAKFNIFSDPAERLFAIKKYLISRLTSPMFTSLELGGPELRFNKLKLAKELLDLIYKAKDEDLIEKLNILHKEARKLEEFPPGYSGGKLGRLLVKILSEYDENFKEGYKRAIEKLNKEVPIVWV